MSIPQTTFPQISLPCPCGQIFVLTCANNQSSAILSYYGDCACQRSYDLSLNSENAIKETSQKTVVKLQNYIPTNIEETELDDLVHDVAGQLASQVNNKGLDTQIKFLIQELGKEKAFQQIETLFSQGRTP